MDSAEVEAWRKAERHRLIALRQAMPDAERKPAAAAIGRILARRFAPEGLGSLGAYWPFRREFNILPFLTRVLAAGGAVALPVVMAPRAPLEFRPWSSKTPMELGVWDIPHPAEGPAVYPTALVAPLVGFDEQGYRLGYGAGYYDRTLAAWKGERPLVIGVGYELGRLPTIHPQPHDVPMDYILTEAGVVPGAAAQRRKG